MARVRLFGNEYVCDPVELRADGLWVMKMHMHGPRWAAGQNYAATQAEIIEMAAAEMPIARDAGLAALEAGMEQDRETLPTVAQLLATAREEGTLVNQKPEEAA